MGLIDHETLHRVMADYTAAFADPSADLLRLLHRLSGDCVAVLRLAGAGMWPTWARACAELGHRAVLTVPMPLHGDDATPIGTVSLYDTRPREWTSDERDVAALLSNTATGFVTAYASLSAENDRNDQLRHALDSRVVIEPAKGMLAAHRGCDVDTAFELMRRHARTARRRVHDVADEIVRGVIPAGLTNTDGDSFTAEGGDAVRSRDWGRPGHVRAEKRQERP